MEKTPKTPVFIISRSEYHAMKEVVAFKANFNLLPCPNGFIAYSK